MKKFIAVLAVGAMFASCKKDYTCTCSTTFNGTTTSASTTINDTKKNAEESCKKGTSGFVTCVIK